MTVTLNLLATRLLHGTRVFSVPHAASSGILAPFLLREPSHGAKMACWVVQSRLLNILTSIQLFVNAFRSKLLAASLFAFHVCAFT